MGTRNLTMVISEGQTRVAQYGQWDGYPGGQGATILDFLKSKWLDVFKRKIKTDVRFLGESDNAEMDKFLASIGVGKEGWMNGDQARQYHNKYPFISRDHGGKILQLIAESESQEILLHDSSDFAGDSLMCEWAYVIDLDNNKLECYQGFVKEPHTGERFSHLPADRGYHGVKLLKSFDLNDLPEESAFIQELEGIAQD